MTPVFLYALLVPLAALAFIAIRSWPRTWAHWQPAVIAAVILFIIGAIAAGPFLAGRGLGSGEASNYSLSIADAVSQFRSGVFPVFVGQTEFAFNGRIHPLRTAPFYCYAAGLLDLISFHRLNFWQLQSLLLTCSLIATAFATFAALRWVTKISRFAAYAGATLYVFSPAVMAASYGQDLYMTVTALPFLPIALAANLWCFRERHWRVYLVLGAAIALTWLAHPPIAIWISLVTVLLQAVVWLRRLPDVAAIVGLAVGAAIGGALALYAFASTLTMQEARFINGAQDYSPMFDAIRGVWPGALQPISTEGTKLSDFQLGYSLWTLLVLASGWSIWKRRVEAATLLVGAIVLVLLVLPVPGFMDFAWHHLPPMVLNVTNIWPMQRLYAIASLLLIFAGAFALQDFECQPRAKFLELGRQVVLIVLVGWTLRESSSFLSRGYRFLRPSEQSALTHRSETVDLTVTSYAMFTLPVHFVNGTVDATRNFRLLRASDKTEFANNWTPNGNPGKQIAQGSFTIAEVKPDQVTLRGRINLQPGQKYVLDFDFKVPPFTGTLLIEGQGFFRMYQFPSTGSSRAFGLAPGNSHSLVLWTTARNGVELTFRVAGTELAKLGASSLANYRLYVLDDAKYPVQVASLTPLRGTVQTPEDAWLESPRRSIPGYFATVDGASAEIGTSPDGAVMLRVPAGRHDFTLGYKGPPLLRFAFWTSLTTGLALVALAIVLAAQRVRQHLRPA